MSQARDTTRAAPAGGAFAACRGALARVDALSRIAVMAAMSAMAALVVIQVFFRYVLDASLDWAEEMARLAFVWAIFLAIPHGVRIGIHVGIDVVVRMLPQGWQEALFRLSAALGAVLMGVVLFYGWQVTLDTWPELMPTVDITAAVYYIAVLIAAVHSFLHLVLLAWGGSGTWAGGAGWQAGDPA